MDEAYTRMLMQFGDLPFDEVIALDRIQKGRPIADDMLRRLRRKRLVEGRKPHLRVAVIVADATGTKADYVERRGRSDEWLAALVHDHLRQSGPSTRAEIVELIRSSMPSDFSYEQCVNKADNLMRKMKAGYGVSSQNVDGRRVWVLP